MATGRLVEVSDTRLFVEERGDAQAFPVLVLHGGPGLDHHMFGDYLDPLAEGGDYRLILVDERAQGRSDRSPAPDTVTLERMTADVGDLAAALELSSYAVLGHSFGAFLALQHAVDFPGAAAATIVSAGVASARWLASVEGELERFEPEELRDQVATSWAREADAQTDDDVAAIWRDQLPFHFKDSRDPRMGEYVRRTSLARYAPDVLRQFALADYGGIEVEDRLASVTQPVLVLSGRYDRTCSVDAGADMARRLAISEFVVFEHSAHMPFVEEQERYIDAVRQFLSERLA
jgi:proline iminopeptidase